MHKKKILPVGFKKSPEHDPENQYDGKFIENVFGRDGDSTIINYLNQIDQGLIKTGCLVGGTKWLYSLEELDQMGDFLFIDEVGQLSIADIITIGQFAKNLVLIGDQNQLGQPIQADHPEIQVIYYSRLFA